MPAPSADLLAGFASQQLDAVVQFAMDIEAKPCLEALDPGSLSRRVIGAPGCHQQSFVLGELDGHPILVVTSGIGLVNAAAASARALMMVKPGMLIIGGTTGGLGQSLEVGYVVAGTSASFSRADATAFGYAYGQVPGMPVDYHCGEAVLDQVAALGNHCAHQIWAGQVVSSDSFVTADTVDSVREGFPHALGADMETAAIAEVCWSTNTNWVSLRAVSDLCGPQAGQDFHIEAELAAQISCDAIRAFLNCEAKAS